MLLYWIHVTCKVCKLSSQSLLCPVLSQDKSLKNHCSVPKAQWTSQNIHNMQTTHLEKVVLLSKPRTVYSSKKINCCENHKCILPRNSSQAKQRAFQAKAPCHGTKHREWLGEGKLKLSQVICETGHCKYLQSTGGSENKHKISSIVRLPREKCTTPSPQHALHVTHLLNRWLTLS